jgi:hypothetical protein
MPRLFLAWVAALAAASWLGVTLAELDRFSPWPPLSAAAIAFAGCALAQRGGTRRWLPAGAGLLPLLAVLLAGTLWPAIDTTLVSQDASVHRASGRWLARSGSLGIPDPTFASLGEDDRLKLFGGASVSPQRISLTRLPGGVVLPDTVGHVAYPSFSHLLAVWVALAEGLGGPEAIALVGPLFAVTAWWAIGLIALADGGLLAAIAAPLLLASLFPEHWFARFLMPEIVAQALVWSGVAAARLALRGQAEHDGCGARDAGDRRLQALAGVLCGLLLGLAGFARLEQFWVFIPALLLARALLPGERRVLPRGALLPLVVVAAHAVLHVLLVPTDYANRIYKQVIGAYFPFVVFVSSLSGHNGYVTGFVLGRVLPVALVVGTVLFVWIGRRIDRRRPGFLARASAAIVGIPWLALIYRGGLPEHFPALRALLLYVPWPTWVAVALGALRRPRWSGLDLALLLQAVDQVVNARVTDQQPWASRRLVTVVLPVVVLAAVRALAREDGVGAPSLRPRPALERFVAAGLVGLCVLLGSLRLAPVVGRDLQAGGHDLVARVAAAVPEPGSAYVIVARPLDWVHLGAALWLGEGPMTLVAREQPWFAPALARFLATPHARRLYVLAGEVTTPGEERDPAASLPPLPPELTLEPVATFDWRSSALESAVERRPREIEERSLRLGLYRVPAPPS